MRLEAWSLSRVKRPRRGFEKHLVDVAPSPVFTALETPNDGMLRRMKVFGRVLVLRLIAAADMSALQAQPQVYPRCAHREALFTTLRRVRRDVAHSVEVRAFQTHA